jgi:tetrahydromethanopterin S-methyltransferase subunit E
VAEQAGHRHRYLRRRSAPNVSGEPGFAQAIAEAVDEEEKRREKLAGRMETLAAIVLSLAAVATAWSAYQSTRWNGDQASNYTQAGAYRTESIRASNEADERTGVAVTLTADWLSAELIGDRVLADALRARMPPDLDTAMQRWLGAWQPGQPVPPGDPFTTGGYTAPESEQTLALERQAEETFAQGRDANQYSDNYVLTGVVFALALFFSGVASRFGHPRNAIRMVYAAAVLLAIGCVLLLVQPKDVGI